MTGAAGPAGRSIGTWVAVGLVGVVIIFGTVFASRFGSDPDLVASPMIGGTAPAVAMPYLEQPGEFSLADHDGDVVVVNFWASWCTGCRAEHEALVTAAAAYGNEVAFVGILHQDRPASGIAFLDDVGRAPFFDYVLDEGSRAGIGFGVLGLPQTFFLDREGTIVGQVSGPITLPVITDTIEALLRGEGVDQVTQTGELENR